MYSITCIKDTTAESIATGISHRMDHLQPNKGKRSVTELVSDSAKSMIRYARHLVAIQRVAKIPGRMCPRQIWSRQAGSKQTRSRQIEPRQTDRTQTDSVCLSLSGTQHRMQIHNRCMMHMFFAALALVCVSWNINNPLFCGTVLLHKGGHIRDMIKGSEQFVHAHVTVVYDDDPHPPSTYNKDRQRDREIETD